MRVRVVVGVRAKVSQPLTLTLVPLDPNQVRMIDKTTGPFRVKGGEWVRANP